MEENGWEALMNKTIANFIQSKTLYILLAAILSYVFLTTLLIQVDTHLS